MRGKEYIKFNRPEVWKHRNDDLHTLLLMKGVNSSIEYDATMAEPIQMDALEKALETALDVHPLFRECAYIENNERYSYFSNSRAKVFSDEGTTDRGEFCSPTVNPYQFRVSTDGRIIRIIVHHSLSDGLGMQRFFLTLLYYYLLHCGFDVIADPSITTLQTPFQKEELEHLTYKLPQIAEDKLISYSPVEQYRPKAKLRPSGQAGKHTEIHIPVHQFKKFADSTHSFIAVMIPIINIAFRRYGQCSEARTLPTFTHVDINLRPLFNNTPYMGNSVASFTVMCSPEENKLPLEEQAMNMKQQFLKQYKAEKFFGYNPNLLLAHAEKPSDDPNIPSAVNLLLSNMGNVPLNETMSRHITHYSFRTLLPYIHCYSGILTYGDDMCLFFDHDLQDDTLFETVREVLIENGLDASPLESSKLHYPKLVYQKENRIVFSSFGSNLKDGKKK